ncbi:MAG: hypothetical protein KatS3mg024_2750 [Armatimonadota bacterium]|nr:MAG: hypothetical protein KatS3mg024_2750 [Armatimonadota bacterium]
MKGFRKMRKAILLNTACAALLFCTLPSLASWDRWSWGFDASIDRVNSYGAFGVNASALDGFDALDTLVRDEPLPLVGVYKIAGEDGWDGPTGFYARDMRAPLPAVVGARQTWLFYTWIDSRLEGDVPWFALGWVSPRGAPPQIWVTITLLTKPEGIAEGPSVGTMWDVSAKPFGGVQLPPFKTSDGREGYLFALTATVIPEPASLFILTAGLAGMGGLMHRRR